MPGQRGTEKRKLAGKVLVRLTAEADACVDAHAAAAGLTRAAWARDVLADAAALPVEDRRPVLARRRRQAPAEDLAELSRLAAWTNRNNGATKLLVVALRASGAAELHADAERLLIEQERLVAEVARLVARLREIDEATP